MKRSLWIEKKTTKFNSNIKSYKIRQKSGNPSDQILIRRRPKKSVKVETLLQRETSQYRELFYQDLRKKDIQSSDS